jgi:hypothetical protein
LHDIIGGEAEMGEHIGPFAGGTEALEPTTRPELPT